MFFHLFFRRSTFFPIWVLQLEMKKRIIGEAYWQQRHKIIQKKLGKKVSFTFLKQATKIATTGELESKSESSSLPKPGKGTSGGKRKSGPKRAGKKKGEGKSPRKKRQTVRSFGEMVRCCLAVLGRPCCFSF